MKTIDWNAHESSADWAGTLQYLIDEAKVAVKTNNTAEKQALKSALLQFSRGGGPSKLCETAAKASLDLSNSLIDDALAGIEERNAELQQLTGALKGTTQEVKNAQTLIQFQVGKILQSMDYAAKTMGLLQEVHQEVKQVDKALADRVKNVLDSMQELRTVAQNFKKDVVDTPKTA
jgi:predicted transcriptional regulator